MTIVGRVCLLLFAIAVASGTPCTNQSDDLVAFVKAKHTNGVPFAAAKSFGYCHWAPSAAIGMLTAGGPDFPGTSAENLVLTLGIMGRVEAIPTLIGFLENDGGSADGEVQYLAYLAKGNVPIALGCLLNQLDLDQNVRQDVRVNSELPTVALQDARSQILDYLVDGLTDSQIWQSRIKWTSPYDASTHDRDIYFVMKTLQGLGLSGDPAAGCILAWTEKHLTDPAKFHDPPDCNGLRVLVDAPHWGNELLRPAERDQLLRIVKDALSTNHKVSSHHNGLAEYYK